MNIKSIAISGAVGFISAKTNTVQSVLQGAKIGTGGSTNGIKGLLAVGGLTFLVSKFAAKQSIFDSALNAIAFIAGNNFGGFNYGNY